MAFTGTCVLVDPVWLGIHYLPTSTVTLLGVNAAENEAHASSPVAIGATSYQVLDLSGTVVGSGTCTATDTSLTVDTSALSAGYFTVVTDDGTNGVVTGTFCLCPGNSNLWQPDFGAPVPSGGYDLHLPAWLGTAANRDFYSIPESTPAQIVANLQADQYFIGPQDRARPHRVWIATNNQSTTEPTVVQWTALAQALVAAGYTGAYYEGPTNEPENAGEGIASSACISQWQAMQQAILGVDPTAHVIGPCSGGIFNDSSAAEAETFLESCPVAAFSNHMENSHQNLSDIVMLRQYFSGLKTAFAAAGVPDLDYWNTETGIEGGQYGVLHPRREARQRTVIRFVAEQFGWCKEQQYDFEIYDHQGSGLPMYLVDRDPFDSWGNMRAGAYALHVMAEALFGTSCSVANPPTILSFGPTGSVGDSLFAGSHYAGTDRDVVVLATNSIEQASVTLAVSATGTVTVWDGMGVETTVPVVGGQIVVPVDDLLTYVFLPAGSTVSVVDTDQGAVSFSGATNLALDATVMNEAGTAVPVVHNGSFGENNSGIPGVTAPYKDSTIPATLKFTNLGGTSGTAQVGGFAIKTAGEAWQTVGCSLTAFTVEDDSGTVYTYECESAVGYNIPSPSNGNSSDPCSMTTWWTAPSAYLVRFDPPLETASLTFTVTEADYGGEPDLASSQNTTTYDYSENSPQQVQLAEVQIYQSQGEAPPMGTTATITLDLVINPALTITTTSLPAGTVGVPYSVTLAATGGVPPYTWSLDASSPALPTGLSLSSAGVISGTPTTAETGDQVVIDVTDSSTVSATVIFRQSN